MKNNHVLLALALCIGLQFNTNMYSSEYLSRALRSASSTVSGYWQSLQNTISNWSIKKKLAVTSILLASLAAIYNRETLMALVDDAQIKALEMQRELRKKQDLAVDYIFAPDTQYDATGAPILNPASVRRYKEEIGQTRGGSIEEKIKRYQRRQEAEGRVNISKEVEFEDAKRQLLEEAQKAPSRRWG